ncbi:MAG: hypothetical protein DHS20C15_30550 [Planctomycetota bacterium]|nr:MAG: hypothetical protein DHS20C15_30550 [Planctomycetota bacterium]
MNRFIKGTALSLLAAATAVTSADAAEIMVSSNIATSTTWTADNTYNLQDQIYVLPGATLTIEAGVVVASDTTINGGGGLAITNGAQIFVKGTQSQPVIMTSKSDVATWTADGSHPTGGDPTTGTWRASANEWGNLTIMGDGYISENATIGNTAVPSASNVASMEGLIAAMPGDTNILYGGGNDADDSGSINHLSIRYGGRVIGVGDELNGLSLGALGRETDISHVEIMNNVDDGVEIWGGCANLKYLSIWNIGDDSLDIDQGYRGKIQFVLIVQGYSVNDSQGSGVGDNCIEHDGAENSHWQPVTTTSIYNATVIGQPVIGDGGTAWRDNARVQHRNSIFMDLGERLVRFDDVDGDGAQGYGHMGTLSWADTWTTDYTATSTVNPFPTDPSEFYKAQTSGKLAEITDSVFFRNLNGSAYTEAINVGVLPGNATNNNVLAASMDQPIVSITRGAPVTTVVGTILPVVSLDPRPANDALTSVNSAPADGFYTPANYRGAFAPGETWLAGWTASTAYGFTPDSSPWSLEGCAKEGIFGQPSLVGSGTLATGSVNSMALVNANPSAVSALFVGFAGGSTPFKGGILKPLPFFDFFTLNTLANGTRTIPFLMPAGVPSGFELWFQWAIQDPTAFPAVSLSNAVVGTTP